MRVLLLGGTGAMGVSLKSILAERGDEVYITSRSSHKAEENIHYLQGDAHDNRFLSEVLSDRRYDAIVDFMVWGSEVFEEKAPKLLRATDQYIFTSSSRVYADSKAPITENSSRLLDVCKDATYLQTDEYALAKARAENVLFASKCKNWTIIRPYITYNVERLQLGGAEKDLWLYRALHGRSILLPKDVAAHQTTMTFGRDVAAAIAALIGNDRAQGEAFHLTGSEHMAWIDVLKIYEDVLERETGVKPKLYQPESSDGFYRVMENQYQIQYDRLYDRVFDNSKIRNVCGNSLQFMSMRDGLTMCLQKFISAPRWNNAPIAKGEAYLNKQVHEKMPLQEYSSAKEKTKYLGWYYAEDLMLAMKKVKIKT